MLDTCFNGVVVIGSADQTRAVFLNKLQISGGELHVALMLFAHNRQRRAINCQDEFGGQMALVVDLLER